MKKYYLLLIVAMTLPLFWGCGDDDDNVDDPVEEPAVTAPKVVSTSIDDGATDIAIGTLVVQVEYDKVINRSSDASLQPVVTGGTLSSAATVSGKNLTFSVSCPDYDTKVTITIPKGLIGVTGALADAYTFSYTTVKKPEAPTGNISATPLTQNAAARKLYTYFYEQYGKKVVSSVMADVNWNHSLAEKVKKLTGKYPAMNCYDFIHIYVPNQGSNGWINYNDITPVKEWAEAGGIVQLMWHFNVPLTETTEVKSNGDGVTCSPDKTTFRASNALKDGTWENKWFYQEMDKVVAVILKLQAEGIAATWRPFHEAAGNATLKSGASWGKSWFWWGYDGADTYKQLWKAMYDYFKQKGVENLIWIWTTQNYNGSSSQFNQDADWYPGEAYVDMVARDLYGYTAAQNAQEFAEIQATYPTKMVVLGECGKGDSGEQGLIGDCWTQGAKWGHFMVWYQGGQGSTDTMCSDRWWNDVMSNENVITRDQLPN